MSLRFIVREGFSGISRARVPAALTVTISFFALVLLGLFGTVSLGFYDIIQELRGRVELEVFFSDAMPAAEARAASMKMQDLAGVKESRFIDKDEARKIFTGDFGEDVVTILGSNPLPRSIRLRFHPAYATPDSLQPIMAAVRSIAPGSDIRYNKAFLLEIEKNARLFTIITGSIGLLISMATVVMVGYTIRLAMYSRKEKIRTMRLVGASASFIASPYLLEGALEGLLAGLLASGALALIFEQVLQRYEPGLYLVLQSSALLAYPSVALLGIILGLFGSALSVSKYLHSASRVLR
ncbi:cell division protein FtsX [Pelodictyon luteolum]|uniref:Cell division protein FtsX n=1 Tax=Chlorobium luteolum (strain DSM 273 / BCRC 81028 / 2530) TaxID=319225 RepID=Q3B5R6_CHLL3|nr:permease-like cell division protein FtsX [Pelodictyon luteolum]ABB23315.1 cell division protein FtsX [Pelodictyon luteolum DSM 273]